MDEWIDKIPQKERDKLEKKKQPDWVEPMLAKLAHDHFSDPGWIYERKLDGERCLAFISKEEACLRSRNNKDIAVSYPEIVEALQKNGTGQGILDGEIVAFEGNQTSFAKLQNRMHVKDQEEARDKGKIYYYVFDVLFAGEYDVSSLPLKERKKIAKSIVDYKDPIRFLPHRNEKGLEYLKQACAKGWEGIIAKKKTASYVHSRSSRWLKFKCVHEQELVIGGFTDPQGSRTGLGALLLGFYEHSKLGYAGKVGTGFDDRTLKDLRKRLDEVETEENPFYLGEGSGKNVHWVEPSLVAQINFTEWTEDNRLRHPRFMGLRRDKDPEKVKKEEM
jgi:DNA ligase D-like protein (predicted ligase)